MENRKVKFDFVILGLKCLDLLEEQPTPKYLGGIERQLVTLSKSLVEAGFSVCVLVYGQPGEVQNIDGVTIRAVFNERGGLRGTRFLYPRMYHLVKAIWQTQPRFVLQMGSGIETGLVGIAVRSIRDVKYLYLVASDIDCRPELLAQYGRMDQWGYRLGLRFANLVLAQTQSQRTDLLRNYHKPSVIYTLPYSPPTASKTELDDYADVLWIGRVVEEKRPHWLVEVAERLPHVQFAVIGAANTSSDYSIRVSARLETLPNIKVMGKVTDGVLQSLYSKCRVLCCTSHVEGFPTTFLEAWYHNIPVVTTFDPDKLVEKHHLGSVCDSPESMSKSISSHLEGNHSNVIGSIGAYFEKTYSPEQCIARLVTLLGLD